MNGKSMMQVAAAMLCCGFVYTLSGQTSPATLVGVVTDPSGLAVGGAKAEVTNTGTNEIRRAESDARGEFTVPELAPGIYNVSIAKDGFAPLEEKGIELQLSQQARMEFHLKMGSVAEKVEITASAPLVNTENAEKGDVMMAQEIVEMPLNGRDFTNLALLTPNVLPNAPGGYGSFAAVNGSRSDNTNFIVDGSNNQTPRTGAAISHPNIDAIEEFKMQTSGYSAEFGRMSGGVVNVALKSGTNDFHGTLFEFLRNDVLNSRNFFSTTNPEYRQNQFGGTIGGPVAIPKLYNGRNKTFFLFSWESYRQISGNSALAVVPTVAMRNGNFSAFPAGIKDPLNNNALFPNSQIPLSRQFTGALAALAFAPLPNNPGVNNYYNGATAPTDWDADVIKIDQLLGSKDHLSFRYLKRYDRSTSPLGTGNLSFGSNLRDHQVLVGMTETHMFTPSLINEARLSFTRTPSENAPFYQGTNYNQQFGMSGGPTDPKLVGFPQLYISGYANIGGAYQLPTIWTVNAYDSSDTVTWVKGPHMIKFGVDVLRTQYFELDDANARGYYQFLGNWTGQPYADFLLGYINNDAIAYGTTPSYLLNTNTGFFFEDDWKVTPRLTLNLGMRYEMPLPMHDKYGRWVNFVPELNKLVVASLASALPGTNFVNASQVETAQQAGLPSSLVHPDYKDLAPRFGLAWRPFGGNKFVFRGGYGIFYGMNEAIDQRVNMADVFPFTLSENFSYKTGNPLYLTMANPFPVGPNLASSDLTVDGMDPYSHSPYAQSWNATIERDLGLSSAIEVAYVGSKGTDLPRLANINQPYRSAATYPNFPAPYPQWSTIQEYTYSLNSIYNALNATFRRRLANNFFYRAAYSYSKSIDEASLFGALGSTPQNSRDFRAERGRSDFDVGHSFLFSFSWEAPSRYNIFLRGWQLAGTGTARTGPPFYPQVSNANLALGQANRPNRIGRGTVPDPSVSDWFDVADFPQVPSNAYVFGNSGRNILDGPGMDAINLALYRNFSMIERYKLQFRWEVFNALNHPNFALPVVNVNAVNAGTITSAGAPRQMQVALKFVF